MTTRSNQSAIGILWLLLGTQAAVAGQIGEQEYAQLLADAQTKGIVRVMVNLPRQISISEMQQTPRAFGAELKRQTDTLLAELGQEASRHAIWNNGLGQVGLYVTRRGLQYLANSPNARSFMRDPTERMRSRTPNLQGRLDAIDTAIENNGWAEIDITLNVSATFDYGKDGRFVMHAIDSDELARVWQSIYGSLDVESARNLDEVRVRPPSANGKVTLRVTRDGFNILRESSFVRSMHLVGAAVPKPRLDASALNEAQKTGYADVVIQLRLSDPYSPMQTKIPEGTWRSQNLALKNALEQVLIQLSGSPRGRMYSEVGTVSARVPYSGLASFFANPDPRVASVDLNKVVAYPALATSTALTNMPAAWNAGYRAAGQNIVIYDTGIRKSHEFFKMNGAPKVTYEFCAGSNTGAFRSVCPQQDAFGDSPLNLPGAGEPPSDAQCGGLIWADCTHGTHVAGIASGRASAYLPSGMQGIAPDAYLISAQVFSYDFTNARRPGAFTEDMLQGLNALWSETTTDNYTANMSIGGPEEFSGDCTTFVEAFEARVAWLHDRGIPVVISTGNLGHTNGVAWPACTPLAIKVAGTVNSGTGNVVDQRSNVGNPANYTGPILLAPGWDVTSSYKLSDIATTPLGGTSMAAPHVAGYYAVVKAAMPGITVNDATAWIVGTGSIPVVHNGFTYRRIRAPF